MAPAPGELALQGSTTTRPDGTFSAGGLPAGNYSLCLDDPPALYVDPCAWNTPGTNFTVVAGSNTALKPITIISGVRVHFLVADPRSALPSGSRLEPLAHIGVVTPDHIFRPAIVNSRMSNVADAMITIPHNQPVTTWVYSKTLKFTDQTGAPAKSSAVSAAPGASDYNIALSVSK